MSDLREQLSEAESAVDKVLSSRVQDPKQVKTARLQLERVRAAAMVELVEVLREESS